MKMLNRIVCSIKRRPYQMVLMFLVVFILGNVLFASIAIKQTSESVKAEIRRRIPAKMSLITDKTLGSNTDPLDYLSMKDLIKDLEKEKSIKKISTIEYMHLNKKYVFFDARRKKRKLYIFIFF